MSHPIAVLRTPLDIAPPPGIPQRLDPSEILHLSAHWEFTNEAAEPVDVTGLLTLSHAAYPGGGLRRIFTLGPGHGALTLGTQLSTGEQVFGYVDVLRVPPGVNVSVTGIVSVADWRAGALHLARTLMLRTPGGVWAPATEVDDLGPLHREVAFL